MIATAGDGQCGGKNIDIILLKYILMCIVKLCGTSPQPLNTTPTSTTLTPQYDDDWVTGLVEYISETNHILYQQLLLVSKSVKEQLSDVTEATWLITLSTFDSLLLHIISYIDTHPPHTEGQNYDPNNTNNNVQVINELKTKKYINKDNFEYIISRTEFESCCHTLIIQAVSVLDRCIVNCREQLHLKINDSDTGENECETSLLDEVVLVGGSSRIPYIQQQILLLLQSHHITPFLPLTPQTTTTIEIRGDKQGEETLKSDQARKSGQGRKYGEARELCHSLDPDLAVVEGLCIQAAVMMGEDVEVLKDVLMLDVLPHSIGVFTWSSSPVVPPLLSPTAPSVTEVVATPIEGVVETAAGVGGGGDGNGKQVSKTNHTSLITQDHTNHHQQQYEQRIFEPVLVKGDRIPCTKYKTFQLEHKLQKFISLDIYEQHIQHHISHFSTLPKELLSTDLNTPKDNTCTTSNTNNMKDTEYTYILMGTYDLPISGQNYECDGKYYIQVEFSLDIHGALSFAVTPPSTTDTSTFYDTTTTTTNDSNTNNTYTTNSSSSTSSSVNTKSNTTIPAVKLHSTFTTTSPASVDATDATSDMMIIYLTIYIVFILVMYISVKVYFQPPSSSTSSVVGGEL